MDIIRIIKFSLSANSLEAVASLYIKSLLQCAAVSICVRILAMAKRNRFTQIVLKRTFFSARFEVDFDGRQMLMHIFHSIQWFAA